MPVSAQTIYVRQGADGEIEISTPWGDSDEAVRDYDESAKDQNHAQRLQLDVDRESNTEHRLALALEWQSTKRTLVVLGGS